MRHSAHGTLRAWHIPVRIADELDVGLHGGKYLCELVERRSKVYEAAAV